MKTVKESRKGRAEENRSGNRSEGGNNKRLERGVTSASAERPKKELPANLLDIFNQIAKFEKEKGVGPKK